MLLDRIENFAEEAGREAIRFFPDGLVLTYRELWDRASGFAGGMLAAELKPGEAVLIFLPMSAEAVVAFLGTMIAGGLPAFMPLPSPKQDPAHYWASHAQLFRHIGQGFLIAPGAFEAGVGRAGSPLKFLAIEAIDASTAAPRRHGTAAFIQHSSGTTGLKKGVVITHEQLARQLSVYAGQVGLDGSSVVVSWLPLYHDMGLIACFLMPLFMGCRTVYIETFRWSVRPRLLFQAIEAERGTHVWLPNSVFHQMVNVAASIPKGCDLSSMVWFVNCSEACKTAAFDRFAEAFAGNGVRPDMLSCCYAMAEAVFAVTQTPPGPVRRRGRLLSSGRPVQDIELRLVDADGRPVAEGEQGEIEIRGPFVFDGYYRDPERTARAFRDGWYRTRDLGVLHEGEIYVAGRTDDMIIVAGRNLFAHEIEAELNLTEGVIPGRSVAFAVEDEQSGATSLVVVCETSHAPDSDNYARLGAHIMGMVNDTFSVLPRDVVLTPARTILKTTSGKVDRTTNKARYLDGGLHAWS